MSDRPFEHDLYNHLSTILSKAMGVPMDQKQVDRLTFECHRLAEVISMHVREQAQKESLKVCALVLEEMDKLKKDIKGD